MQPAKYERDATNNSVVMSTDVAALQKYRQQRDIKQKSDARFEVLVGSIETIKNDINTINKKLSEILDGKS